MTQAKTRTSCSRPLAGTGKLAVGSMGDDTRPRRMLDRSAAPARGPLQAALRAGDEPAHRPDPRRLGVRDRRRARRPLGALAAEQEERQGAPGERSRLHAAGAHPLDERARGARRLEGVERLDAAVRGGGRAGGPRGRPRAGGRARAGARRSTAAVLVLSDRGVDAAHAAVPTLRAREPAARRARQGGPAPPRRARGGRGGLGHPPRGAARLGGRRRGLPVARLPERGRARGDVPEGPAQRLRRGDVDDGGDAGLGLLRRQADRGGRARSGVAAHGVPRRARATSAASAPSGSTASGSCFHSGPSRPAPRRPRRRRRVPLPQGTARAARQQPGRRCVRSTPHRATRRAARTPPDRPRRTRATRTP